MNKNRFLYSNVIAIGLFMSALVTVNGFAQEEKSLESMQVSPSEDKKSNAIPEHTDIERALMQGSEIQGSIEKPYVVYIVPWKDGNQSSEEEIPFDRHFREEILAPLEYSKFHKRWGKSPRD